MNKYYINIPLKEKVLPIIENIIGATLHYY